MATNKNNTGKCALCGKKSRLQNSHVIPSFVGKYLKDTSVTGRMRRPMQPNKPVQDLDKDFLFCRNCEELMAIEEKYFAERIFFPYHNEGISEFQYNHHLGRFCAIQSLRNIIFHERNTKKFERTLKRSFVNVLRSAKFKFRELILSEGKYQKEYSNHLFFLDIADSPGKDIPDIPGNLNWYWFRVIDMDIPFSPNRIFVYNKLCRIIIMTFLIPRKPTGLYNTRIYKSGKLGMPQAIKMPNLLPYIFDRASNTGKLWRQLSERQQKEIDRRLLKNKDKVPYSEAQKAMDADEKLQSLHSWQKTNLQHND